MVQIDRYKGGSGMWIRSLYVNALSVLCCTILIGCSSAPLIKEVPNYLKPGKLYLAPKTVEVAGREFNTEEGFVVVRENPSDTLSRKSMLPVLRIRESRSSGSTAVLDN